MPQKETLSQLLNIHFISDIDKLDTDLYNFGSLN